MVRSIAAQDPSTPFCSPCPTFPSLKQPASMLWPVSMCSPHWIVLGIPSPEMRSSSFIYFCTLKKLGFLWVCSCARRVIFWLPKKTQTTHILSIRNQPPPSQPVHAFCTTILHNNTTILDMLIWKELPLISVKLAFWASVIGIGAL